MENILKPSSTVSGEGMTGLKKLGARSRSSWSSPVLSNCSGETVSEYGVVHVAGFHLGRIQVSISFANNMHLNGFLQSIDLSREQWLHEHSLFFL